MVRNEATYFPKLYFIIKTKIKKIKILENLKERYENKKLPPRRPQCSCSRRRQSPCSVPSGHLEPSAPYPAHQIYKIKVFLTKVQRPYPHKGVYIGNSGEQAFFSHLIPVLGIRTIFSDSDPVFQSNSDSAPFGSRSECEPECIRIRIRVKINPENWK